jgi:hypothetical protein
MALALRAARRAQRAIGDSRAPLVPAGRATPPNPPRRSARHGARRERPVSRRVPLGSHPGMNRLEGVDVTYAIVRAIRARGELPRPIPYGRAPHMALVQGTLPPRDTRRSGDNVRRRCDPVAGRVPLARENRKKSGEAVGDRHSPICAKWAAGAMCAIVWVGSPAVVRAHRTGPPHRLARPRREVFGRKPNVSFEVPLSNEVREPVDPIPGSSAPTIQRRALVLFHEWRAQSNRCAYDAAIPSATIWRVPSDAPATSSSTRKARRTSLVVNEC